MKTDRELLELAALEEDAARRVAHIMGESSAAALAVKELERRRSAGDSAYIIRGRTSWYVGTIRAAAAIGESLP